MLAAKNKFIQAVSETIYRLSQNEEIRLQCEAREDYYRRLRSTQLTIEEDKAKIKKQRSEIKRQNSAFRFQNSVFRFQNSVFRFQNSAV